MNKTTLTFDYCVSSVTSHYIFFSWFAAYLSLLPLFLFVLYVGFCKWTSSQSSASGSLSHSDVFTLNTVAMEMINVIGSCCVFYGFINGNPHAAAFGGDTILTTMTGQTLFHSLTCVERYLAVVHPVTYLRLRGGDGVTIRNICIAFVWTFSIMYTVVCRFIQIDLFHVWSAFFLYIALLPVVIYCSVCVLCVLIRPKPGEQGGHRKQMDQSKLSTVYTIVAILGILLLKLISNVTHNSLYMSPGLKFDWCVVATFTIWTALPSSLVLPLLFLYRAGKLRCCR